MRAARLEQRDVMRERIAKATYELHATIGPARTTISAIAERAGVQRHTVYHHFPDIVSLFQACTAHSIRVTRPPDPETWRAIPDPAIRVRAALRELYDHLHGHAQLWGNVHRDMPLMPEAIDGTRQFLDLQEAWFDALAEGWPTDGPERPRIEAALRHALDYATWHSLTTQGLSDDEAADAMTAFVTMMATAGSGLDPTRP
jgi:AcrR family transcriptional regulator